MRFMAVLGDLEQKSPCPPPLNPEGFVQGYDRIEELDLYTLSQFL